LSALARELLFRLDDELRRRFIERPPDVLALLQEQDQLVVREVRLAQRPPIAPGLLSIDRRQRVVDETTQPPPELR